MRPTPNLYCRYFGICSCAAHPARLRRAMQTLNGQDVKVNFLLLSA